MADDGIRVLAPRRRPGDQAVPEVIGCDGGHARVLLGAHQHSDREIGFYAEGRGVDRLGQVPYDVGVGDVLLVTPGIVHDASGLHGVRGWAVEFAPEQAGGDGDQSLTRLLWSKPLLAPFVAPGRAPTYARFTCRPTSRPAGCTGCPRRL